MPDVSPPRVALLFAIGAEGCRLLGAEERGVSFYGTTLLPCRKLLAVGKIASTIVPRVTDPSHSAGGIWPAHPAGPTTQVCLSWTLAFDVTASVMGFLPNPKQPGHRAAARRQDCADQQQRVMGPRAVDELRRERQDASDELAGRCRIRRLWRGIPPAPPVVPASSLQGVRLPV